MPPQVAISIVTHQSRAHLDELFASLRAHTDLDRTPIIAVDNASTDGSVERLRELSSALPHLEVLAQPRNTGFAGGNNIAIERARRLGVRYVLLLNPDTAVTPGWLDALVAVMEARPEVAAAQPLLMLWDEPERINSAGNRIHFCGFAYCGGYRQSKDEAGVNGQVLSVPYASGAALCLRMSALDEVGVFDERMFLYHEECDLQLRLRHLGHECVLVPTARVLHKYGSGFTPQKYGWLERNRWMMLIKDWPAARLVVAAPALAAVEVAVLVFAARSGWLPQKFWAYGELIRHLPETLAARSEIQARRRWSTDIWHLTGEMQHPGIDHPLLTHVANPLLTAYWRAARKVLRFVDG
jgi:GT2 family glycosyltransferase